MKPFSLLIKPAGADCNLRCDYCFYRSRAQLYPATTVHRMDDETLDRLVRGYMSTTQPQYAFAWQGGEPTLMGTNFFRRVTQLQQKHGMRGSSVANSVQTNATLITDDLAAHFAEYNFLVGVSLDGPPELHDRHRTTAVGKASHANVIDGVIRLRKAGVDLNILTLVNRSNVDNPSLVYRYLVDNGFLYQQFIPCVEFDGTSQLAPFAITGEQWGAFLCGVFDEWIRSDTRTVSIREFDSILTYLVEGRRNTCRMDDTCCQYFVVEHNGDIYPCDFFVDPALKIGNIRDTTWQQAIDSTVYHSFGKRKSEWCTNCDDCEFVDLCAGDCPKFRPSIERTPVNLSVLCAGWKRFFRHTLAKFRRLAAEIIEERRLVAACRSSRRP